MAISLVNNDGVFVQTTNELFSEAFVMTAGNLLITSVAWIGSPSSTVTGVADTAGNTYAPLTRRQFTDGSSFITQQMFYVASGLGNAANIVHMTFSATLTDGFPELRLSQWHTDTGALSFDVETFGSGPIGGGPSIISNPYTTTSPGDLVYSSAIMIAGSGPIFTAGPGATLVNVQSYGDQYRVQTGIETGAQESMNADRGTSFLFNVAAFKVQTVGPTGTPQRWPSYGPYSYARSITPSDTAPLPPVNGQAVTDALYVGGAGVVAVVLANGTVNTLTCAAGQILPVQARGVNSTNTTATALVALYAL